MHFNLDKSIEILENTPIVLISLLSGLSDEWIYNNEGDETWNPFDVLGHLIHGEKTDWIPRMQIILSDLPEKTFTPFDRFAQFEESKNKNILMLLDEFKTLRASNLTLLKNVKLSNLDLQKQALHPALGIVTLQQLLSTWVVHDLNHIAQICRELAYQYKTEVGPWNAYLGILQ